ncbi:MAG: capsule assembly Wzi family protein [Halanaerobiales bacterium]|nr:capsule assembly Wzi family protein [Halanaerobiales bacterium]
MIGKRFYLILTGVLLFGIFLSPLIAATEFAVGSKLSITKEFANQFFDGVLTGQLAGDQAQLAQLYLRAPIPWGVITVGRQYLKSGPGYFSNLVLSDQIPLNAVYHQIEYEQFIGTQLVAYLGEGVNKQLFFHRLETEQIYPGLQVGVFESMIASEYIHPAYYIPFPYWPYYLTAKLLGLSSNYNDYEDKYLGLDFIYELKNNGQIYGELLVDEFPQRSRHNNPDKRAHLLGFFYPLSEQDQLRIEYSNVFNYVYQHRYRQNNYSYRGEMLGHWLGPDGDVIDLELERVLGPKNSLKMGLQQVRKGSGKMGEDYGSDHAEKKFLAELIRRELNLKSEFQHRLNADINLKAGLAYGMIEEYRPHRNYDIINLFFGLEIKI